MKENWTASISISTPFTLKGNHLTFNQSTNTEIQKGQRYNSLGISRPSHSRCNLYTGPRSTLMHAVWFIKDRIERLSSFIVLLERAILVFFLHHHQLGSKLLLINNLFNSRIKTDKHPVQSTVTRLPCKRLLISCRSLERDQQLHISCWQRAASIALKNCFKMSKVLCCKTAWIFSEE